MRRICQDELADQACDTVTAGSDDDVWEGRMDRRRFLGIGPDRDGEHDFVSLPHAVCIPVHCDGDE